MIRYNAGTYDPTTGFDNPDWKTRAEVWAAIGMIDEAVQAAWLSANQTRTHEAVIRADTVDIQPTDVLVWDGKAHKTEGIYRKVGWTRIQFSYGTGNGKALPE